MNNLIASIIHKPLIFIRLLIILIVLSYFSGSSIRLILFSFIFALLISSKVTNSLILKILIISSIIIIFFISSIFIYSYKNKKSYLNVKDNETIIVLGGGIVHDRPNKFLQLRLDKAIEIMKKHKNIKCIVSGSQGIDEDFTESYVMKKYLVENGIEKKRVFEEDKSFDTIQNIKYSKEIIEKEKLSKNIIIITNPYHTYRSHIIARELGLEDITISSDTPDEPSRFFHYVREVFSHFKVIFYFKIF